MIPNYKRHNYYIIVITIILFISVIFTAYLYRIYITQKKTIENQLYSLSLATSLNTLIFDTRKLIISGDESRLRSFIKQITIDEYDSINNNDSVGKYAEFKVQFLNNFKSVLSLKKQNYLLHQEMVNRAISSYDAAQKMAHDLSLRSDTQSNKISDIAKELVIAIANARQIDRDFQLESSIQKKQSFISSYTHAIYLAKSKIKTLQNLVYDNVYETELANINEHIHIYEYAFIKFSNLHLSYISEQHDLYALLENIDVLIDKNNAEQHQYLNKYNNSTRGFLIGLTLFLFSIIVFIILIYNDYLLFKNKQKIEKEKNIQISKFLARMSHEIRTPLNGIIGTINLMQIDQGCVKCGKLANYIDTLSSSSISLKNHIDNVLDLSKIEAGVIEISSEYFSLNEFFTQVENVVKPIIKESRCEYSSTGNADLNIFLDKTKLRQILLNYISNSIKYSDPSKPNSHIKVDFKVKPITNQYALTEINIMDNGIGMSKEHLSKFSEPFHQFGSWQNNSSGLGANVAKNYVKLLGGQVWIKSKLGEGTLIRIMFKSKIQELPIVNSTELSNKNIHLRVLVIEDNVFNRKILVKQLEVIGCDVTSLSNGLEAKNHLLEGFRYDIYITDIRMPQMNGVELTKFIRGKIDSNVPVIALTADALKQDHQTFRTIGITKVLTKPIFIDDLTNTLTKLHNNFPEENLRLDKNA